MTTILNAIVSKMIMMMIIMKTIMMYMHQIIVIRMKMMIMVLKGITETKAATQTEESMVLMEDPLKESMATTQITAEKVVTMVDKAIMGVIMVIEANTVMEISMANTATKEMVQETIHPDVVTKATILVDTLIKIKAMAVLTVDTITNTIRHLLGLNIAVAAEDVSTRINFQCRLMNNQPAYLQTL
jgi:hypothetical protein